MENKTARNPGLVAGTGFMDVEVAEIIVGATRCDGKPDLFEQAPTGELVLIGMPPESRTYYSASARLRGQKPTICFVAHFYSLSPFWNLVSRDFVPPNLTRRSYLASTGCVSYVHRSGSTQFRVLDST